ncbi:hypothetical protein AMS68_000585 [Peltaster fructicola]|uniref:Uncharacterized protein n=1 Tax=Peltaster fructicola TaxID=286661 RepID=A0A6H0XKA9_9PEZI|nr:hypothetical protein AMS68_000585 [Peltaster fructicola]
MPGSGKQTPEVQSKIVEFLEAGIDPTTIHKRLKVGRSSVYRMKRCLQQYGTAYAPVETNKKNGRPSVMNAEQEKRLCDWLRDPRNQDRYLDDMVWFIHEQFGMVCSTTTCSKLKRKWIRVIEAEARGERLDPAEAQEQVRLEALASGKKSEKHIEQHDATRPEVDLGFDHDIDSRLQSEVASAALRVA